MLSAICRAFAMLCGDTHTRRVKYRLTHCVSRKFWFICTIKLPVRSPTQNRDSNCTVYPNSRHYHTT